MRTIAKSDPYAGYFKLSWHAPATIRVIHVLSPIPCPSLCKFTLHKEIHSYIIQETLIYIVCLSVEVTSNNFPGFFLPPWVPKSSTRPPLSPLKRHLRGEKLNYKSVAKKISKPPLLGFLKSSGHQSLPCLFDSRFLQKFRTTAIFGSVTWPQ